MDRIGTDQSAVDRRSGLWIALSDLYVDTELDRSSLQAIARRGRSSGFTLDEMRRIDRYEVAPLLYRNLLNPAGVWEGFKAEWIVAALTARYRRRTWRLKGLLLAPLTRSATRDYWHAIESAYAELEGGATDGRQASR